MQKKIAAPLAGLVNAIDGWEDVPKALQAARNYLLEVDRYLQAERIYFWTPQEAREFENLSFLTEKVDQLLQQCSPQPWWSEEFLAQSLELQELLESFVKNRDRCHQSVYPELDRLIGFLRSCEAGTSQAQRWLEMSSHSIELVDKIQQDLDLYADSLPAEVFEQIDQSSTAILNTLQQAMPPAAAWFEEQCTPLNKLGEWNLSQRPQLEFNLDTLKSWKHEFPASEEQFPAWLENYLSVQHPVWLNWWQERGKTTLVPLEVRDQIFPVIERKFANPELLLTGRSEATAHLAGLEKVLDLLSKVDLELKNGLDTPLDISIQVLGHVYRQRLPIRSLQKIVEKFEEHNLTGTYLKVVELLDSYFQSLDGDLLLEALELLHGLRPLQFRRSSQEGSGALEFFSQESKKLDLEL